MQSHTEASASTSTSSSSPLSLPAPAYLSHCPSAILLQLANDSLSDRDVARWAACERRMLSVFHAYSIKAAVSFDEAWKWRWDSLAALMEAVKNPNHNSGSESGSTTNINTDANTAAATGTSSRSRSPFRIGRLRATMVDDDKTMQEIMKIRGMNGDDGDDEAVSVFMQRLMSAYLPTTVECIIFQLPLTKRFLSCNLPHHITQLYVKKFDGTLSQSEQTSLMESWILPPALHSMRLCGNKDIGPQLLQLNRLRLPGSLTKLHLGAWHGRADELPTLPPNPQSLHMGYYFNAPLDCIQWPQSLQSLTLSEKFNHPLQSVRLPDSLTYLKLGDAYNHPIEGMHLPSSLTHLEFGWYFRQPLCDWTPPHSLISA